MGEEKKGGVRKMSDGVQMEVSLCLASWALGMTLPSPASCPHQHPCNRSGEDIDRKSDLTASWVYVSLWAQTRLWVWVRVWGVDDHPRMSHLNCYDFLQGLVGWR